jgi:Tfp pilus assembly protein FimT
MKTLTAIAITAVLLALAAPARADTLASFHTPSKNIQCLAVTGDGGASIDCEILEKAGSRPLTPRPADCDLEWGNRFEVGETGKGTLACTGDTVRDDTGITLGYDTSFTANSITCTSTQRGLTCLNSEGHGFFLSRARQQLF